MPIQFCKTDNRFILTTEQTEYIFDIVAERYLTHRYYGQKSDDPARLFKAAYRSFSPYPEKTGPDFSFTDDLMEFGFFGGGDFRCASLRLRGAAGDSCTRFFYQDYEIFDGRKEIPGVPCARPTPGSETLAVHMQDPVTGCRLTLYYTVFPKHDLISRYFTLENQGDAPVTIEKAMSLCLDLPGHGYDLLSLHGAHVSERQVQRLPLGYGVQSVTSRRGASSHQANPFIALLQTGATETNGAVYAFNFVYSGSFLDEVEVDQSGNTRVGIGLGAENFSYLLQPGESFTSPEAVMLHTVRGLGDMSRKLHRFVREAILPPDPYDRRPVVLNTWEACYFDIDESTLLDFAREGVRCGLDMLVMDDGWFGERKDDRAALGDWFPNRKKFPDGLQSFAARVKATGIRFGIWIEPEMISPDSDLYRSHPDWCLSCKGREGSLSRNQLVLDLSNPDVCNYLKRSFRAVFYGVPIDYIKWDFNRHLSEVGSPHLPPERQGEVFYRFQLGVYDLFFWFMENFPGVMIENCSGGGGRYDLAMMAVSTQIWASDNTNATDRVRIQYGSLLGYPASVMSCHVSDPGRDAARMTRLDYKFKVALGGMLGYELNILTAAEDVRAAIQSQIMIYREVEDLVKYGDLYRLLSPFENELECSAYYYTASPEMEETAGERIFLSLLQNKGDSAGRVLCLPVEAADPQTLYIDRLSGERFTGATLHAGLEVPASPEPESGRLWLFEKAKDKS